MNIELSKPTRGALHEHISSPPALPICFDSSSLINAHSSDTPLDFVVNINAIAWGLSGEHYPWPRLEEVLAEWASVEHNIPAILSKWRNYGLFGTNIEGWFTLDTRDTDSILRAIALFGFVLWVQHTDAGGDAKVLCGFHRSLGVNTLEVGPGIDFEDFVLTGAEAYVVIPTLYVETDHVSSNYLKYDTLETQ
jgi:hypothetical protein